MSSLDRVIAVRAGEGSIVAAGVTEIVDLLAQGEARYNMAFAPHVLGDHEGGDEAINAAEAIFRELDEMRWLVRVKRARSLGLTQTEEQRAAMMALVEGLADLDDPVSRAGTADARAARAAGRRRASSRRTDQ